MNKSILTVFLFSYSLAYRLASLVSRLNISRSITQYFALRQSLPMLLDGSKCILFHCASMGEYETIKPIARAIKKRNLSEKLVVSFFSPSGFDNCSLEIFDHKIYSPLESAHSVNNWLDKVNPKVIYISENELWPTFLKTVIARNIPIVYLGNHWTDNIKTNLFLKSLSPILSQIQHFFVEQKQSKSLLNELEIKQVTLTNRLRDEEIRRNTSTNKELPKIDHFKRDRPLLVLASIHKGDLDVIDPILSELVTKFKVILVPHDVSDLEQSWFITTLSDYDITLYSSGGDDASAEMLIIDEFGILRYVYKYADIVYVGGGFDKGIHNIVEPAAHQKPIIIGPNHQKFTAAQELLELGVLFECRSHESFNEKIDFITDKGQTYFTEIYSNDKAYQNSPSQVIMDYLDQEDLI